VETGLNDHKTPPRVAAESARLAALARYRIIDTLPERVYDDLARVARALAGTQFAAVTLIDRDRQYLKARVGTDISSTPRSTAICDTAIRSPERALVIEDARADPRFADFATVAGPPYIRRYAGAPLVNPDGHALGTICVFDGERGQFSSDCIEALQALARQVITLLELRARNRELHAALGAQREQQNQLAETQRELVNANIQLLREAREDALSGLKNRRALEDLEQRVDEGEFDRQRQYAVLELDVDHFKRINDSHGHAVGDEVIRAIGDILRTHIRADDLAFRLGGEEFGVFLPGGGVALALRLADRIRSACAAGEGLPFPIKLSGGIATGSFKRDSLNDAFERADRALYEAKLGGRDRVVVAGEGD
jgi:diguanylate cyclase (GGDEF)-like protein